MDSIKGECYEILWSDLIHLGDTYRRRDTDEQTDTGGYHRRLDTTISDRTPFQSLSCPLCNFQPGERTRLYPMNGHIHSPCIYLFNHQWNTTRRFILTSFSITIYSNSCHDLPGRAAGCSLTAPARARSGLVGTWGSCRGRGGWPDEPMRWARPRLAEQSSPSATPSHRLIAVAELPIWKVFLITSRWKIEFLCNLEWNGERRSQIWNSLSTPVTGTRPLLDSVSW